MYEVQKSVNVRRERSYVQDPSNAKDPFVWPLELFGGGFKTVPRGAAKPKVVRKKVAKEAAKGI